MTEDKKSSENVNSSSDSAIYDRHTHTHAHTHTDLYLKVIDLNKDFVSLPSVSSKYTKYFDRKIRIISKQFTLYTDKSFT